MANSSRTGKRRSNASPGVAKLLLKLMRMLNFSLLAFLYFITSILINFVQLINYLLFEFTFPVLRRNINFHLQDIILSQNTILLEWHCGCRFRLFFANEETKNKFGKEQCLVMGNHRFQVDAFFYWLCCQMTDSLGCSKAYAKSDLKWMPIIGWAFWFGDFIFLNRNWRSDSKNIGPALDRIMDYPYPCVMLILPEGTRFTPEKHQAGLIYAKEHNIPLNLKYHLLPRVKGFASSLRHLQSKHANNFGIYNIQLVSRSSIQDDDAYEPSLENFFAGKPFKVDCFLEKIDNSLLPPADADEETEAKFVYSIFEQKDKLMEHYDQYKRFPTPLMFTKKPEVYRFIRFILLNYILSGGLVIYLFYLAIITSSLTLRITILGLILSVFVGIFLIISLLQNSNYGKKGDKKQTLAEDRNNNNTPATSDNTSNGAASTQQVHT